MTTANSSVLSYWTERSFRNSWISKEIQLRVPQQHCRAQPSTILRCSRSPRTRLHEVAGRKLLEFSDGDLMRQVRVCSFATSIPSSQRLHGYKQTKITMGREVAVQGQIHAHTN